MDNIVNIASLPIGTTVSFQTVHKHDNNIYEGTIVGTGSYNVVKSIMDILPYYQGVKQSLPDMEPMTNLNYFILEYFQESVGSRLFVCAYDWVKEGTVKPIYTDKYFDIRIYNEDEETQLPNILSLLQAHNYNCSKTPVV